jgi:8-oxo-dGTP pyrophosphatase MutT (NUDIX family)
MAESSPRHSVSVAAAIVDESGQLLAVRRRDNGHWEPPGGILELHETIPAGLVREVREETGLEVEPQGSAVCTRTCAVGSSLWCSAAGSSVVSHAPLERPSRSPGLALTRSAT